MCKPPCGNRWWKLQHTKTTARALLSAKSIPSLTFPRQTARNRAPFEPFKPRVSKTVCICRFELQTEMQQTNFLSVLIYALYFYCYQLVNKQKISNGPVCSAVAMNKQTGCTVHVYYMVSRRDWKDYYCHHQLKWVLYQCCQLEITKLLKSKNTFYSKSSNHFTIIVTGPHYLTLVT